MLRRLAGAVCVMVVLLTAADAGAEPISEVRETDPVGDVRLRMEKVEGSDAKDVRNADVTAALIRRTSHQLLVRLTYRDLSRDARGRWSVHFSVSTSGDLGTSFIVVWQHPRWGDGGQVGSKFVDADDWSQGVRVIALTPEDAFDTCHASGAVDDRRNTVTIRIPSRCLNGNPTWMRVEGLKSRRGGYADNPFNSEWRSESTPPLFAPRR